MKLLVASFIAAMIVTPRFVAACPGLEAQDPWVRLPVPGATVTAAYARLRNAGRTTLRVDGARSAGFGSIMLHRTVVEDGMTRMRHGEPLALAPGELAALEPGGWHLMLIEPRRQLRPGDTIKLALTCAESAKEIEFIVKTSP